MPGIDRHMSGETIGKFGFTHTVWSPTSFGVWSGARLDDKEATRYAMCCSLSVPRCSSFRRPGGPQIRSKPGQVWPALAQLESNSTRVRLILGKRFGQARGRPNFGQLRPMVGRHRPNLAESAQVWPVLVEVHETLVELGPN